MFTLTLDGPQDGNVNMARDRDLLAQAEQGQAGARFYTWSRTWVTLGKFQTPEATLLDLSVPYTVRPTGGAAVLHGHDLTLGLAVPLNLIGVKPREVRAAYRAIVSPIVDAFTQIGIPCALGEDLGKQDRRTSPYCFGLHSANDIITLDTGQKVCGCAMHLSDRAVLLQASIPASPPLVDPLKVIQGALPASWLTFDAEALKNAWAVSAAQAFGTEITCVVA
jgi:lipoyl(octanoyl) transferase